MKPPPFEYHRPQTVEQMVELLDQYGEGARILAGGQSLMPSMNFRLSRPEHITDINQIQELDHLIMYFLEVIQLLEVQLAEVT